MQLQQSFRPRVWLHAGLRLLFIVAITLVALALSDCRPVQSVEAITTDIRTTQFARGVPSATNIIVVAIDDYSLQEAEPYFGRWPWPRAAHAAILDQCKGAEIFGMDILLPERVDPVNRPALDEDNFLARVDSHANFVAAAALTAHAQSSNNDTNVAMRFSSFVDGVQSLELHERAFLLPPYPKFAAKVDALGFVNIFPDQGGTVRHYPMFIEHAGVPYPSFAVSIALRAVGNTNRQAYVESPIPADQWLFPDHRIHLRGLETRVAQDGEFRIVYNQTTYPVLSAIDVIHSYRQEQAGMEVLYPRSYFDDKIVLFGSTATGLQDDRHATPLGTRIPGVLIHATAIDNLLTEQQFRTTPPVLHWILCFLMTLMPWVWEKVRPQLVILISALTLLSYILLLAISTTQAWLLPATSPVIGWSTSLLLFSLFRWDREQRRSRHLERIERAKQQFTDMLVHDLKGQIGNLGMSVEMLDDAPLGEEYRPLLQAMGSSSQRMLSQVHSLLDIRRMEEGRMPLRKESASISSLVDRVVKEFQASADFVGLRLEAKIFPSVQRACDFDPDVMYRVLANLVLNAIQYAKKGSAVTIEVEQKDDNLFVSIRNEGRNLPAPVKATLFQPFHYFDQPGANTRSVSTGLGLAFCKLAMDAHGGHIELESPWADGTAGVSASIRLPG